MRKYLLFLAFAGIIGLSVNAQNVHNHARCYTTDYYVKALAENPIYYQVADDLENFTKQYIQNLNVQKNSGVVYTIPLVFHILHDYGSENVDDAVIIEAVRQINVDFRKQNADTTAIVPAFKALAADCEIEFKLATIDPLGNCTNGIEHIYTKETYLADNDSKTEVGRMVWPNNKYLNIWVAHTLANPGAAAWANYPGQASNLNDGIMCWYTYVDNFNNTLTHELGHSLNLPHVWGSTNEPGVSCGDDGVSDTPITKGFNQGTNCPLNAAICNPPIIENVQNYMEYSFCDNMFTIGQKNRMQAALNSSVGGRNNLWTNTNLLATGTDGSTPQICAPKADFKVTYDNGCSIDSIEFTDQSWRAGVTNWNWSFPGGNPSTSNLKNPKVLFPAAGQYDVTLVASNATGSDTVTKSQVVRITANPLNNVPFVEGFEDPNSFPGNDGWIQNLNADAITWQRITNAASTGTSSIRINNYTNTAGNIDEWISPSLDFSNIDFPVVITFKIAAAQRSSATQDQLRLFYSLNCGKSWAGTSYSRTGAALATAGIVPANFTPNNPSQWREETVTVNAVKLKPNVRFKFQNISDHGNNVYIDDINMTGNIVGIDEEEVVQTGFSVYPNPTSGSSFVEYFLIKSATVSLEVKDILGKTVARIYNDDLTDGDHKHEIPALSTGVYLIELTVNNKKHIKKLVVS